MRVPWPLLLLLLLSLSGCMEDPPGQTLLGTCERPTGVSNPDSGSHDWSLETLHVTLDGPHDVLLPVPVNQATHASQWADVAGAEVVDSVHGTMLHLVGAEPLDVIWCIVQPAWGGNGCCAEHFLDSRWTSDATGNGTVWAKVDGAHLTVAYGAQSNWCGIHADDTKWTLKGPGWSRTTSNLGASCE